MELYTREQIENFIQRDWAKIYARALHLTRGNEDYAGDVVADACVKMLRAYYSFNGRGPFIAWAGAVLTNVFLDRQIKSKHVTRCVSLESFACVYGEWSPCLCVDDTTHDELVTRLEFTQVLASLERLSPALQEVIKLYFIEDLSYEEIMTAIGVPMGTVKSRLFRARRALLKAQTT